MQENKQLINHFNAGLLEMRELFHGSGRLEDSNAKLDEITKLLCLEIANVRDPESKVPSLRVLLESYGRNGLVAALNDALVLAGKSSILTNYDGESLLGPNPKFNIAESEEPLARALAQIVLTSFNGYLRENHTSETFEFLNEAFCHFVRDNFRQNIEDAQYMTPPEAVNYMVDLGIYSLKSRKFTLKSPPIVCDPSCGVGSFLAQFYRKWATTKQKTIRPVLVGQDKVDRMARLSILNLALFGIIETNVSRGNSLLAGSPLDAYLGKCDLILTNPPFGARFSCAELSKQPKEFFPNLFDYIHSREGDIDSELLFLDRYFSLLRPGGVLLAVLPDSVISSAGIPAYLREKIQERFTIRSITELPAVTFAQAGTRTRTCILEAEKREPNNSAVIMGKAISLGYEVSSKKGVPYKKPTGENQLVKLLSSVISASGNRDALINFQVVLNNPSCVAVTQETISKEGWTPSHYSSERLTALQDIESIAGKNDFEILSLKSIVNVSNKRQPKNIKNKNEKCISVLHLGAFGALNVKELLEYEPKTPGKPCEEGDILFSKINPRIPRALVVPHLPFQLTCSTEFEVMRPKPGYSSHEIMLLLLSEYAQKQIQSLTSGTSSSHNRIKTNQLLSIKLIIPKTGSPLRDKYEKVVRKFAMANTTLNEANTSLQETWKEINSITLA